MTTLHSEKSYYQTVYSDLFSLLKKNTFPLFIFAGLILIVLSLFLTQIYFIQKEQSLISIVNQKKIDLKKVQKKVSDQQKYEQDKKSKEKSLSKFSKAQFFKTHDSSLLNKKIKLFQKKHKVSKIVMKVSSEPENIEGTKLLNHHVNISFQKNSLKSCMNFLQDIEHKIPGMIKIKHYQIKKDMVSKNKKKTPLYNVKMSFDWLIVI